MREPTSAPTPGDGAPSALPATAFPSEGGEDTCRWVRIQIPRYLDAELAGDLAERVSRHLGGCAPCREERAEAGNDLLDTIDLLVAAEPPADLAVRIEAHLDAHLGGVREETPAPRIARPLAPSRRGAVARLGAYAPGLAAAATLAIVLWALPGEEPSATPSVARVSTRTPAAAEPTVAPHAPAIAGATGSTSGREGSLLASATAESASEPRADGELLFSGGIECITFEEAIDTIILGPRLAGSGLSGPAAGAALLVRRGDIDGNGRFEWRDLQGLYGYLRQGQESETAPECLAAADFDGDGAVTVHDSVIAAQALAQAAEWTNHGPTVFAYESDNPLPCRVSCP